MPQYFFNLSDGETVLKDETGDQLAGAVEAMAQAAVLARELADDDGQWHDHSVVVLDEDGVKIGTVPISP